MTKPEIVRLIGLLQKFDEDSILGREAMEEKTILRKGGWIVNDAEKRSIGVILSALRDCL